MAYPLVGMGYFYKQKVCSQTTGIVMTNESKFLGYLDALKGTKNQKLIECVQNGFKTLVEYQVVGNMSERGVDLMEGDGEGSPVDVPEAVRSLVDKLTSEIEELRDAMGDIDNIAGELDEAVPADVIEIPSELEEVPEERGELEESLSDEGQGAADAAYEQSSEQEELGGIKNEKNSGAIGTMNSGDVVPIETGERRVKVEECNYGRESVTEFGSSVGLVAKLGAQLLAGVALDKLIARVTGDDADSAEKAEVGKEIEAAAGKMRDSQTEGLGSKELPDNVRQGESAGNDADDSDFVDNEGKMAKKQLGQISDQSEELSGAFDDKEELKAWVQVKITKAQETIDSLYDFFREDKGLGEEPEVDMDDTSAVDVEEQPIFEK